MIPTPPMQARLPFRRRLARTIAGISITLFVLLCAEWARTGYRSDLVWVSFGGAGQYSLRSDWGRLVFTACRDKNSSAPAQLGFTSSEGGYADAYPDPPTGRVEYVGVELAHGPFAWWNTAMPGSYGTYWRLRTYYPLPLVLVLLPAIPWAVQARRDRRARRRLAAGLCPKCGYDLRGRASDHCPECGTPVSRDFAQQPASTVVAAGAVD
jgi:hypothetical protein